MTTQPADGPAQVEATYTFASKGPPDGDDAYDVKDGMAMVSLTVRPRATRRDVEPRAPRLDAAAPGRPAEGRSAEADGVDLPVDAPGGPLAGLRRVRDGGGQGDRPRRRVVEAAAGGGRGLPDVPRVAPRRHGARLPDARGVRRPQGGSRPRQGAHVDGAPDGAHQDLRTGPGADGLRARVHAHLRGGPPEVGRDPHAGAQPHARAPRLVREGGGGAPRGRRRAGRVGLPGGPEVDAPLRLVEHAVRGPGPARREPARDRRSPRPRGSG